MNILMQFLAFFTALAPSLAESKKIITDQAVRKENSAAVSTTIAKIGIGAGGVLLIDQDQPPEVVIACLLASIGLYLYRRRTGA